MRRNYFEILKKCLYYKMYEVIYVIYFELYFRKTYTNDYDIRFFNRFVNTGYASIITKDELIMQG